MDRGGRFAETLNPWRSPTDAAEFASPSRIALFIRRFSVRASNFRFLRNFELIFLFLFLGATTLYGGFRGGHMDVALEAVHDFADAFAQNVGFETAKIQLEGAKRLSRRDVLRIAGITESSTLFLIDAESTRARILRNPWIAEAAVRKLYPDQLEIIIKEKQPFAVWQDRGMFSVIARDGTVIDQITSVQVRDSGLPFVVGAGADKRAESLLALLDRFPKIRSEVAAAVFVAERRWNLRLNSGIDVRLPEDDADVALLRLVSLDREKSLLSRDVTVIDLRLPDRVAVRLSDDAAQARDIAMKDRRRAKGANI
jgi:cell division protein FtsQ